MRCIARANSLSLPKPETQSKPAYQRRCHDVCVHARSSGRHFQGAYLARCKKPLSGKRKSARGTRKGSDVRGVLSCILLYAATAKLTYAKFGTLVELGLITAKLNIPFLKQVGSIALTTSAQTAIKQHRFSSAIRNRPAEAIDEQAHVDSRNPSAVDGECSHTRRARKGKFRNVRPKRQPTPLSRIWKPAARRTAPRGAAFSPLRPASAAASRELPHRLRRARNLQESEPARWLPASGVHGWFCSS